LKKKYSDGCLSSTHPCHSLPSRHNHQNEAPAGSLKRATTLSFNALPEGSFCSPLSPVVLPPPSFPEPTVGPSLRFRGKPLSSLNIREAFDRPRFFFPNGASVVVVESVARGGGCLDGAVEGGGGIGGKARKGDFEWRPQQNPQFTLICLPLSIYIYIYICRILSQAHARHRRAVQSPRQ